MQFEIRWFIRDTVKPGRVTQALQEWGLLPFLRWDKLKKDHGREVELQVSWTCHGTDERIYAHLRSPNRERMFWVERARNEIVSWKKMFFSLKKEKELGKNLGQLPRIYINFT
jgi:hypothetical protein